MFVVEENWIPILNLITIAVFILCFARGWHRGIFLMAVTVVSTIVAAYVAWVFSPVLAKFVMLMPKQWAPMQDTALAVPVYLFCNRLVWFFLLLIGIRILFVLLAKILKGMQKLPVIKQAAEVLGGALGIIEGAVWCMVLAILLCTPLFTNGALAVQKSYLGVVQSTGQTVFSSFITPVIESEQVAQVISGSDDITKTQQDMLEEYMKNNGLSEVDGSEQ